MATLTKKIKYSYVVKIKSAKRALSIKKKEQRYYGITLDNKFKILVFSEKSNAEVCADFLEKYVKKYKNWPSIGLAQNTNQETWKELEISLEDTDYFSDYCRQYGVPLLHVIQYQITPGLETSINMKATEIEQNQIDIVQYMLNIEQLYLN